MKTGFEDIMSLITRLKIKLPRSILEKVICGGYLILKDSIYLPPNNDVRELGISFTVTPDTDKELRTLVRNSGVNAKGQNQPGNIMVKQMLSDILLQIYRYESKERSWNRSWIDIKYIPASNALIYRSMSEEEIKDYIVEKTLNFLAKRGILGIPVDMFKKNKPKEYIDYQKETLPKIITFLQKKKITDQNLNPLYTKEKFDKFLDAWSIQGRISMLKCSYRYCGKTFPVRTKHQINLAEKGSPVYCPPPSSCKQLAYKERKKEEFREMQKLAEVKSKKKKERPIK